MSTPVTPRTSLTSSVTDITQWPQVMPVTVWVLVFMVSPPCRE